MYIDLTTVNANHISTILKILIAFMIEVTLYQFKNRAPTGVVKAVFALVKIIRRSAAVCRWITHLKAFLKTRPGNLCM